MTDIPYRTALIVGAGPGISASVARGLAAAGFRVGLAARNVEKLTLLATETGAETFAVDAPEPAADPQKGGNAGQPVHRPSYYPA
jgi:NADP-dependent 3-hydroxy acid dehydrogenase YdfG